MLKFSESDTLFPRLREKKIEEFNLAAIEENLKMMHKSVRFAKWTFVIAFLSFVGSGIALAVSLLK